MLFIVGVIGIGLVLIAWFVRQASRWTVILIIVGILIVALATKMPT